MDVSGPACRQAHRHQLSGAAFAVAGARGRQGRCRAAVRLGRNRTPAWPGGCHLRSGVQRRDSGGESAQAGSDPVPERGDSGRPDARARIRAWGTGRPAVATVGRRTADPPQQTAAVPGDARASSGATAAVAGCRVADGDAGGWRGSSGTAGPLPRSVDLAAAGGPQARRCDGADGAASGRNAGMSAAAGQAIRPDNRLQWRMLDAAARASALRRPAQASGAETAAIVAGLIDEVRAGGDAALRELTARFDGVAIDDLAVSAEEFAAAQTLVAPSLRQAIVEAAARIEQFHTAGMTRPYAVDTAPGVRCERVL